MFTKEYISYWKTCSFNLTETGLCISSTTTTSMTNVSTTEKVNTDSCDKILQAVQGNPPNNATGRVGAVGQIHFICNKDFKRNKLW